MQSERDKQHRTVRLKMGQIAAVFQVILVQVPSKVSQPLFVSTG
jgi:hypothetical protein